MQLADLRAGPVLLGGSAPGPASVRGRGQRRDLSQRPRRQDPLGHCADGGVATCGLDGKCNGIGACRKYAVNTVCGMDSCSAGAERAAGRCDAAGTARRDAAFVQPVVAATTNCKTSCTTRRGLRGRDTAASAASARRSRTARPARPERISASPATASRASAATPGAPPTAMSLQPDGHRGDVHGDRRRRRPHAGHAVHGHGRHVLRHRRQVQRRGRVPAATGRERTLAARRAARVRRCRPHVPCDGMGGTCRAATTSSCTPLPVAAPAACKTSCTTAAADCVDGQLPA